MILIVKTPGSQMGSPAAAAEGAIYRVRELFVSQISRFGGSVNVGNIDVERPAAVKHSAFG